MVAASALFALTACSAAPGNGSTKTAESLTLYNGQHESTTELLVSDFTKATGITVKVRSGEDPELANQIVQEGSASPADVFYSENSPALTLLSEQGKLAPVSTTTKKQIPAKFSSPNGDWVGIAGRAVVLAYNPEKLATAQVPASILDVGGPTWSGKVGIAPSGADFQAIVAGVIKSTGVSAATTWLEGLKRAGQVYPGNSAIMQAVNRGEIPAGIIYHYYWFRDQAESGANSANVKMHYFGNQDPGAFLSISGAGVLKSSTHQEAAQKLVQFLSGTKGQTALADSDDFEYPLNASVPANPKLKPLAELELPDTVLADVGNGKQVIKLLQQVGLL
ncbi:MAG: iron ABC transporter substrate-binding protein [Microbacteriaceae bacterium]